MNNVDVYAGRFAGSFDLSSDEASGLGHDSEVTMLVRGIVKKLTLEDTRSGELRLFFVVRPLQVTALRDTEVADVVSFASTLRESFQHDPEVIDAEIQERAADIEFVEVDNDEDPFAPEAPELPDGPPTGARVSTVQPHSNVAGSSQAERDSKLAAFLYD